MNGSAHMSTRADVKRLMVKQYVAVVRGDRAGRCRVFETGDPQYYLFDPIDGDGCSLCSPFAVRKADLRPEVRQMLRHGFGNDLGGQEVSA